MTFEDFRDIHQNDSAGKKLNLLMQEMDWIATEKQNATVARYAWRNLETAAYHDREAAAHKNRAEWLFGFVEAALAAAEEPKEKEGEEKMTIAEFVKNVWENEENGAYSERMDLETAKIDLNNFRSDGWDLPEGITPESYMEAWNELVEG